MFRFATKKGFVKTGNDTCESHTETIFELTFFALEAPPYFDNSGLIVNCYVVSYTRLSVKIRSSLAFTSVSLFQGFQVLKTAKA